MDINQAERQAFFNEGFFLKENVFTPDEIRQMQNGFDQVWEIAKVHTPEEKGRVMLEQSGARLTYEDQSVRHIAWCGKIDSALAQFGSHERLRGIAHTLLETPKIEQLINQAHYKMPGDNIAFPWHQDIQHRGAASGLFNDINGKGSYVQIAIPLDDVTEHNGPLGMIPRSCHLGHLPHETLPNGSQGIPPKYVDTESALYPQPKTGDILVFGPYTIHGSTANTSDSWRRVFINGFAAQGANAGKEGVKWQQK
jgi:ectoine hydroxylase-related dioxygenase (phytanoyl-CoA dioxygenase family)